MSEGRLTFGEVRDIDFPKQRTYISGQITGLDLLDAQTRFEKAADFLKRCDHDVVNPFDLFDKDQTGNFTWKEFMSVDIQALFTCDTIYMLNNWKNSRGARIEHTIAIESDMNIIYEK